MNPMVPGLRGGKMSSSEADSKIDMLEASESLRVKLDSSVCPQNQRAADGNGVLAFFKFVVFPLVKLASGSGETSNASVKVGDKNFTSYDALEDAFIAGEAGITAESLRNCIFECLDPLMEVGRRRFAEPQLAGLLTSAYPPDDAMCVEKHATGGNLSLLFTRRFFI